MFVLFYCLSSRLWSSRSSARLLLYSPIHSSQKMKHVDKVIKYVSYWLLEPHWEFQTHLQLESIWLHSTLTGAKHLWGKIPSNTVASSGFALPCIQSGFIWQPLSFWVNARLIHIAKILRGNIELVEICDLQEFNPQSVVFWEYTVLVSWIHALSTSIPFSPCNPLSHKSFI
jgi:hypothetical protein